MSTGTAPNTQGVYSPLPFSDTDSSEEEVFNTNTVQLVEKHVTNRKVNSPEHLQSSRNGKKIQPMYYVRTYVCQLYVMLGVRPYDVKYFRQLWSQD